MFILVFSLLALLKKCLLHFFCGVVMVFYACEGQKILNIAIVIDGNFHSAQAINIFDSKRMVLG